MDFEQIDKLIAKLEASKLRKLVYKKGDFELQLEKDGEVVHVAYPQSRPKTVMAENVAEGAHEREISQKGERGGGRKTEPEGKYVTSPMVGTFFAAPSPDAAPFVKIGDIVNENTVVCIIEAMKVMNEVKAGASGKIAEILADNGQPVEFGSKLLRIV